MNEAARARMIDEEHAKKKNSANSSQQSKDKTDVDLIKEEIDWLLRQEEDDVNEVESRGYSRRPPDWRRIACQFMEVGLKEVIKEFPLAFQCKEGRPVAEACAAMRCRRWKDDYQREQTEGVTRSLHSGPQPAYGDAIDKVVAEKCRELLDVGQTVNDLIAREFLVVELQKTGKSHLLDSEGGKHSFSHSWAQRFFKRNNLTPRGQNMPQMVELSPSSFDEKKAAFISVLAGPCKLNHNTGRIPDHPKFIVRLQQ